MASYSCNIEDRCDIKVFVNDADRFIRFSSLNIIDYAFFNLAQKIPYNLQLQFYAMYCKIALCVKALVKYGDNDRYT